MSAAKRTQAPPLTAVQVSNAKAKRAFAAIEKNLKLAASMEPIDWQERIAPTVPVKVNLGIIAGVNRTKEEYRKRAVDARLWDSLDGDMQDAVCEIYAGRRALVAGLGMKPASLERIDRGKGDMTESMASKVSDYNAWIGEVSHTLLLDPTTAAELKDASPMAFKTGKAKGRWTFECLNPEAVTGIVCEGYPADHMDSYYGRRKGWAAENLKQALLVWLYRKNRRRRPELPDEPENRGLTMRQVRIRNANRRLDKFADILTERGRVIRRLDGEADDEFTARLSAGSTGRKRRV